MSTEAQDHFWIDDADPEDGHAQPYGGDTVGIVDSSEGGVIAYVHRLSAQRIIRALLLEADSPGESVSAAGVRLGMNVVRNSAYKGIVFVTALGEQGAWHTDAATAIAEAERIRSVFPNAPVTLHAGFDVA